jgi:hypothetical protein
MHCPHCGQEHPDTTVFCPVTGQKLTADFCTNCGAELQQSWKVCPKCGTPVSDTVPSAPIGSKKILLWITVSLSVLLLAVAVIYLMFGGQSITQQVPTGATTLPSSTNAPTNVEEIVVAFNNTITQANMQPLEGEKFQPVDVQVEGEWAIIEATYANNLGTPTVGEGAIFLGRHISGQWEVAIPGTETYKSWLDLVPESLLSDELKQFLR